MRPSNERIGSSGYMDYCRKRFAKRFRSDTMSGCWLWTGATRSGYGQFFMNNQHVLAHRASWELHCGPIPDGKRVCHSCDTPLCVRPSHLFLSDQSGNIQDMHNKGRGNSKLSAAEVEQLRTTIPRGHALVQRAKVLGVDPTTIRRVLNNRRYLAARVAQNREEQNG